MNTLTESIIYSGTKQVTSLNRSVNQIEFSKMLLLSGSKQVTVFISESLNHSVNHIDLFKHAVSFRNKTSDIFMRESLNHSVKWILSKTLSLSF